MHPVTPTDDLFFIAHEERTGRPRPHPRVLGVVLAAGLLGELVFSGHLFVAGTELTPSRLPGPPVDPLAHRMLEEIRRAAHHREVEMWLEYFGLRAVEDVGQRLVRAGVARRMEQSRLLRPARVLWLPADGNDAEWRAVRLAKALRGSTRIDLRTAFLAGLVQAAGLLGDVLWDPATADVGRAILPELLAFLARTQPGLYVLVSHADAAVGKAVLVGR